MIKTTQSRDAPMLTWLMQVFRPKKTQSVDDVLAAYVTLLEKYPLSIMDLSALPLPKQEMKALMKAGYAKVLDPKQRLSFEHGFMHLANFQEGVGPVPISFDAGKGLRPTAEDIARLDRYLFWQQLTAADSDVLLAEWREFRRGFPL